MAVCLRGHVSGRMQVHNNGEPATDVLWLVVITITFVKCRKVRRLCCHWRTEDSCSLRKYTFWWNRTVFDLDFKKTNEQLSTMSKQFQTEDTEQRKVWLANWVLVVGLYSNGMEEDWRRRVVSWDLMKYHHHQQQKHIRIKTINSFLFFIQSLSGIRNTEETILGVTLHCPSRVHIFRMWV